MFASSSHHCIYKFQLLSKIEQIFDSWKEHYQAVIFPTFVLQAVVYCFFNSHFLQAIVFRQSFLNSRCSQTVIFHKQSLFTNSCLPGNFSKILSLSGRSSLMSEDSSLTLSCLTFLASSSNSRLSRMTATKSDITIRVTNKWYKMK